CRDSENQMGEGTAAPVVGDAVDPGRAVGGVEIERHGAPRAEDADGGRPRPDHGARGNGGQGDTGVTEFKVGDVGRLKSGGAPMTVEKIMPSGGITCCWHASDGRPESYLYGLEMLIPGMVESVTGEMIPVGSIFDNERVDWRKARGL